MHVKPLTVCGAEGLYLLQFFSAHNSRQQRRREIAFGFGFSFLTNNQPKPHQASFPQQANNNRMHNRLVLLQEYPAKPAPPIQLRDRKKNEPTQSL